jgi:hypothetical protein
MPTCHVRDVQTYTTTGFAAVEQSDTVFIGDARYSLYFYTGRIHRLPNSALTCDGGSVVDLRWLWVGLRGGGPRPGGRDRFTLPDLRSDGPLPSNVFYYSDVTE